MITDLTGTTWIFNPIINFDETYQTYIISFVFNEIVDSEIFEVAADTMTVDGPASKILYSDSQVYNNEWEHEGYRTISINDGIDITNTRLIAWLQENATMVTSDVSVSYKDKTIAILSGSKTLTLNTSGKYCTDNITLNYTKPSFNIYYTGSFEPDSSFGNDGDIFLRTVT